MDKARDVRRGATRFKHSRHKPSSDPDGVGEDVVFSEKSKGEKLKKLSAVVGRSSSSVEDGKMASDRQEDELRSSFPSTTKRFKLSEKFLDDCNGVGHASVPRRLRSAMKKRSRESISPLQDTKKPRSSKFDANRKSKSNMKRGGSDKYRKPTVSVPITKDEEEVANALYALAGMFFNNNANDNSEENNEISEANPSDLPQSNGSHKPSLEVAEEIVSSSSAARLAETVKVESCKEPDKIMDEANLPHSEKLNLPLNDSAPQLNLNTSSSLSAKTEETCDVKPTCNSVKFCIPSDAGVKESQQMDASVLERKPETALGMATPLVNQMEPRCNVEESKKTGLTLWPGLPSTVSRVDQVDHPCLPSSAAKLPPWLDVAFSAVSSGSVQNDSFGKISKATTDGRLSKRCAIHVYISRLIQALRMSENNERLPLPQGQVGPHEILKQGYLPTINNFIGVENVVNRLVSASGIDSAVAKQNPNGAKTGVLQPKLQQDYPFSTFSSAVSTFRKQNFDFYLSLARGGGIEISDSYGRARNGMEPLSPLQNPYLPSLVQHQFSMPFSLPQSYYNSSACSDHLSSSAQQVHMQLPSYSSPFYGAQSSPTSLTKHQQQQTRQPQQRLWGAHYRPEDAPKTTIQFLSLQNGPMSQRQQQHSTTLVPTPLNPVDVMRQDHHLPSVYEEPVGGFRTTALPLQLLCSERL